MGGDGFNVGVQIRKFVIIPTRICYRSVCDHPFLVGCLLFLLFLYRSFPFLFSLLVSTSPVLVCTAVLLGTLLSFGEPNVSFIEEDDRKSAEISQLKTGTVESTTIVEKDENFGRDSFYTELRREILEGSIDEEPLIDNTDRVSKFETDGNAVLSSLSSDLPSDHRSREIRFEKLSIDEANSEFENLELEQKVDLDDQKTLVGAEVGLGHDEVVENRLSGKVPAENFEDYKSAEGSVDAQVGDEVESSTGSWKQLDEKVTDEVGTSSGSWKQLDENPEDRFSPFRKVQAAVHARIWDQLESSFRSWKQWDEVGEDKLSSAQRVQTENFEDYKSAEGSVDAKIQDQLESSFASWKQLDSDHDGDDESESGSDGAESSSPDASLADIIPMLDELHPLLEDENPQTSNLSRQSSVATMARSGKSHDSSIHSEDESDEMEEEEACDTKSDGDDDDDEEEAQGSKEDPAKSAITWTEDDQKNLMDLGTSELERNQRLESLIARRRARRNMSMMTERNLIDLDGMDLQFQVAPISTTRHNPFDFPHDSYDDLGLPPIPGSAPSVLLPRRNPFDLPYDSSEEKPDLTGDSFQEEFLELSQSEVSNQREAVFRRNETFSMGSSFFDFGRQERRDGIRPSRFRPYFIPERTDSDVWSYSSLQRQASELSESKVSSVAETESISACGDEEEKKPMEHESSQEMEPISEIEQASLLAEHGSQSSEDVHSLSDEENENEDFVDHVPEVDLGRDENSPVPASPTSGTGQSAEITLLHDRENDPEAESWMHDREIDTADIHLMQESIEEDSTNFSLSSFPVEYNDGKLDNVDEGSTSKEESQVNFFQNDDISVKYPLEKSVSDMPTEHSLEPSDFSHAMELDDLHPKEPVYDSSPHALKKNHSSSSTSSYLQMETPEIDLYHLSSIHQEVLGGEEPNVQDEEAERNAMDIKQGIDDDGLTVNQTAEGAEDGISECRLPEANQHPITSGAPLAPGYEVDLSIGLSDTGMAMDNLLDDKVYPHEEGQVLTQEDDDGILMEAKREVLSEDFMPSAVVHKSSEDLILAPEKSEVSIFVDQSCSEVELREETRMEKEAEEQFLASSSSLKNLDNDVAEKQVSAFDESQYFPCDSAINDPCSKPEQESSIIHRKHEDLDQEDKVDGSENVALVQGVEDNILLDPLHSDDLSSQPEEFVEKRVAELVDKEHVPDKISEGPGVSGADDQILYDFTSNIKDMDEELLSELDAVGDFSVNNLSNKNASKTYSNAEADSGIPEQVRGEAHSSTAMPFSHDMSSEANTDAGSFEPLRDFTEPNVAGFEESNLKSHKVDVSTGLLVLEPESVVGIDAAFKKEGEGEVQKYELAESVQTQVASEQLEALHLENELLPEDIELSTHVTELASPEDDAAFNTRESVVERIGVVDSMEGHNLEYNRRETDLGMLAVDAEKTTEDDEDYEKLLQTETEFNAGDSLPTSTSTSIEVGSVEHATFQIDKDIEKVQTLSVVEANTAPEVDSGAQAESVSLVESEPLQIDRDIISPVFEASVAPSVEPDAQVEGVLESETLQIDRDVEDFPESADVEAIAPAIESKDHTETVGVVESESVISKGVEEVEDLPVDEASRAPSVKSGDQIERVGFVESASFPMNREIEEIQEPLVVNVSSVPSIESEYQIEKPGVVESESLLIEKAIKEIQDLPVAKASSMTSVESENQIERLGPLESESIDQDIKEIQESPVIKASIAPSVEFEHQTETVSYVESESSLIDKDIKEINESPVIESSIAVASESEDQTERVGVGSLEDKPLQIDADIKGIQESPVVEASIASSLEIKNQTEVAPPHLGVVLVQAPQDHQSATQQQSDGLVPDVDDPKGAHIVKVDSTTTVIESTGQEYGGQGSSDSAVENFSPQSEEGKSNESHLEFSTSPNEQHCSNSSE